LDVSARETAAKFYMVLKESEEILNLRRLGAAPAHGDGGAKLESRTAGAIEVPQRGDVRSIRAHASGVNRQTQVFGLFDAHACFIQFGQAIALRGNQLVPAREIYRTRRAVRAPALSHDYKKIVPVSSIPHISPQRFRIIFPQSGDLDAGADLSVTGNFSKALSLSPARV
jgi:hypothetical protein